MDPDFKNAKRALIPQESVFYSIQSRPMADTMQVGRYWVLLRREYRDECIAYLNTLHTLLDPESVSGSLPGTFRHVAANYSEVDDELRIVQTLEAEVNEAGPVAEETTRWRYKDSKNFPSGSKQITLELPHVDPSKVQAIVDDVEKTYSNSLYTSNSGVMAGTWYDRGRFPIRNPETGYVTIYWVISTHYNTDASYVFMANPLELHVHFSKRHMVESGYKDFTANYYFDLKDYYYSADGVNFTQKNGEVEAGALPATAKLAGDSVAGRVIEQAETPREDEDTTDLYVRIVFHLNAEVVGEIIRADFDTVVTELEIISLDAEGKADFFKHTYLGLDGSWYYAADDANYTRKNGAVTAETPLPVDAAALLTQVAGRAVRDRLAFSEINQKWRGLVTVQQASGDERISMLGLGKFAFKRSKDVQVYHDEGFNVSKADMDELKVYYNGAIIAGTARTFEFERLPNGNYNYTGVEIMRTGYQTSFTLGTRTYHLGNHMALPPSTDPLADPEQYTVVAATGVVSDVASENPEDATWNWRIVSQADESYEGMDDPLGGQRALVEYGSPEKHIRLCRREVSTAKPNNGLPDVGSYEDIYVDDGNDQEVYPDGSGGWIDSAANAYAPVGTVETLTGMRLVETAYNNLDIKDGKYHYDRLEIEYNAPRQKKIDTSGFVEKGITSIISAVVGGPAAGGVGCLAIFSGANVPAEGDLVYIGRAGSGSDEYPGTYYMHIESVSGDDLKYLSFFTDVGMITPVAYNGDPSWTWPNIVKTTGSPLPYAPISGSMFKWAGSGATDDVEVGVVAHGFVVGDKVYLSGLGVADGPTTVTRVIDVDTFTIDRTTAGVSFITGGIVTKYTLDYNYIPSWFYMGINRTPERDEKNYFSGLAARITGGMTIYDLYNKAGAGAIAAHEVVAASWRQKSELLLRKYFIRKPLVEDLISAGIDVMDAPDNELGSSISDRISRLGEHLFAVDRTITLVSIRAKATKERAGSVQFTDSINVGQDLQNT